MYLWDTYKKKYGKFVGTAKKIILPGLTFMIDFTINLVSELYYEWLVFSWKSWKNTIKI